MFLEDRSVEPTIPVTPNAVLDATLDYLSK